MAWEDGVQYEGEWEYGKMKKGRLWFAAESNTYDGEFSTTTGHFEGKGRLVKGDGDVWEGFYKDGKLHGLGTASTDGLYAKGNFRQGLLTGDGCESSGPLGLYKG